MRAGHVTYVINTLGANEWANNDGFEIRRCAVENNVTMFTSLDTVSVLLDVLEEITVGVSNGRPRAHEPSPSPGRLPHVLQAAQKRLAEGGAAQRAAAQGGRVAAPREPATLALLLIGPGPSQIGRAHV